MILNGSLNHVEVCDVTHIYEPCVPLLSACPRRCKCRSWAPRSNCPSLPGARVSWGLWLSPRAHRRARWPLCSPLVGWRRPARAWARRRPTSGTAPRPARSSPRTYYLYVYDKKYYMDYYPELIATAYREFSRVNLFIQQTNLTRFLLRTRVLRQGDLELLTFIIN